jgi:hypothetical protein
LGHFGMLEGRRIDRVSPAARFVSCVSPIRGPRHVGDTNRPLAHDTHGTRKRPARHSDDLQAEHFPAAGGLHVARTAET